MTTQTPAQNRKKPRGRPFPPGNNANPGGRPKLPEDVKHVRELARQYTSTAIATLASVMEDGRPARVQPATACATEAGSRQAEAPQARRQEDGRSATQ